MRTRPQPVGPTLLVVVTAALLGPALALGAADLVGVASTHPRLIGLFVLLLVGGELAPVRLPSGRLLAPLSTAAALTLALLGPVHGEDDLVMGPWTPPLLLAACQGIALAVRPGRDRASVAAARLIGVAAVAWLARGLVVDGRSFVTWWAGGAAPGWLASAGMLLLALAGLLVERLVAAAVQARGHRRLRTAIRGESSEAGPFTLAISAAAPMAALMAPVLGAAALPLALVPVGLTAVAVRRYAAVGETFRQTVRALSRLTEEGGYTPAHHSERVADLARAMGERLGVAERELLDLEYSALLHDLGQVSLREPLEGGATIHVAPADQQRIADHGAEIVRRNPGLVAAADIIATQAVPYRAVVEDLAEVPLSGRVLKVANAFDDLTGGRRTPAVVAQALERIELGLGYEYDPVTVAALATIVGDEVRGQSPRATAGQDTARPL